MQKTPVSQAYLRILEVNLIGKLFGWKWENRPIIGKILEVYYSHWRVALTLINASLGERREDAGDQI
jgi:hypothetical protein